MRGMTQSQSQQAWQQKAVAAAHTRSGRMYTFGTYTGIYAAGALLFTVVQAYTGGDTRGSAAWAAWWLVTGLAATIGAAAAIVGAKVIDTVASVLPPGPESAGLDHYR